MKKLKLTLARYSGNYLKTQEIIELIYDIYNRQHFEWEGDLLILLFLLVRSQIQRFGFHVNPADGSLDKDIDN